MEKSVSQSPRYYAQGIFRIIKSMDTLEKLPRTGYLLRGVANPENVAAHSFGTALLTMLLADAEQGVNSEKAIRMAILHETGEVAIGDIPYIAKKHFPAGTIDEAESSAAKSILSGSANDETYISLFDEYIDGKTKEAKIVRAADKLQMLCKVRFYQQAGAGNLEEFFINDQGMDLAPFPVAKALYKLLCGEEQT